MQGFKWDFVYNRWSIGILQLRFELAKTIKAKYFSLSRKLPRTCEDQVALRACLHSDGIFSNTKKVCYTAKPSTHNWLATAYNYPNLKFSFLEKQKTKSTMRLSCSVECPKKLSKNLTDGKLTFDHVLSDNITLRLSSKRFLASQQVAT